MYDEFCLVFLDDIKYTEIEEVISGLRPLSLSSLSKKKKSSLKVH